MNKQVDKCLKNLQQKQPPGQSLPLIHKNMRFSLQHYRLIILIQLMSSVYSSEKKHNYIEKQGPSKVLLVCVYDTLVFEITNQAIYQKFCKFGKIVKLLIFERHQVTKFFIEYSQIQHSTKAKSELDGTKLCGTICKMNIYFSNFSNVDLKDLTSQGADYSQNYQDNSNFVQRYDILTKSSPSDNTEDFNDLIMHSFDAFSPFSRSKTDNPINLISKIAKINAEEANSLNQDDIDFDIKSNIDSILDSNSNSSKGNQKHESLLRTSSKQKSPSQIKIKQTTQQKNSILYFQYRFDIEIRQVYNLFSNFGNITCINKKRNAIYIKFRTIEFAAICFTYLNNYSFMGNQLRLQTPLNELDFIPKENIFSECIYFDASFDRFTPFRSITINSPSLTLHVSSLKKDICQEDRLIKIFRQFGQIQAVQILKQTSNKNMALVKYYKMEDSFKAIAQLHNCIFSGRKIQISFTKSRV